MNIKEVEGLLGIPRANIRYYEKEGLLSVKRKQNQYRDYTADDISRLKRIIVLRKVGVSVEDICRYLNNEKTLAEILDTSIEYLQTEYKNIGSAIAVAKRLERESVNDFDECYYFDIIKEEEKKGNVFVDLCRDIGRIELDIIDDFTKHFLFFDFKKHRENAGVKVAVIMLLGFLLLFGLGGDGFIDTVKFPLIVLLAVSTVCFPVMFVKVKLPRVANVFRIIMVALGILSLILLAVALIVTTTQAWG
ncbi:MAG: MerR family transcriptional regulator [Clostridia bacterium]|nr:MerR family transcriptional regulator [Clostridia bacterium]